MESECLVIDPPAFLGDQTKLLLAQLRDTLKDEPSLKARLLETKSLVVKPVGRKPVPHSVKMCKLNVDLLHLFSKYVREDKVLKTIDPLQWLVRSVVVEKWKVRKSISPR